MKKVYLSGGIYAANVPATEDWRRHATKELRIAGEFRTIDPCRNRLIYDAAAFTPNEITARDYSDLNNADIILLNGNPVGDHLGIGTWCEMERTHQLGKPIIVFSHDDRVREHPWVKNHATKIFTELTDALKYIVNFWRE